MSEEDQLKMDISLQAIAALQLKAQAIELRTTLQNNMADYIASGGDKKSLMFVDKKIDKILALETSPKWGKISASFSSLRKCKSLTNS
jgi:hypothetical protein